MYYHILGLAYYALCENKALHYYEEWKENNYFLENNEEILNSKGISKFLKRLAVDKKSIEDFFHEWIKSQKTLFTLLFDITSFSTYSNNIEFVEWGHNRDCEGLPQINYGIITDEKSNLPLYYKIYPGSISDVTTLKNILKNIRNFKIENATIILDKGFFSGKNINEMNGLGKFIIPLPFSVDEALNVVNKNLKILQSHTSAFILKDELLHYAKDKIKIEGKNYIAHIYYNEQKASEEKINFMKKLIELYMKRMGCCVIITNNTNLSREETLDLYHRRNNIEQMFDSLKNELDCDRLRAHSQETIEARLFIKFIALIIHSAMLRKIENKKEFCSYSIKKLLFELRKLKIIFMNDDKTEYLTELSRKQKDLFKLFGVPAPFIT